MLQKRSKLFYVLTKYPFHHSSRLNCDEYLQRSEIPTNFFQNSLPRLPIPKLENSCQRYLASQKVLLNDSEFAFTKRLTEDFLINEGRELNNQLVKLDKKNKHTSYVSSPWFDMYFTDRNPVVLNQNPTIVFKEDPNTKDQSIRATNFIISSMRFKKSLESNILRPEVFHLNSKKTNNQKYWKTVRLFPKFLATYCSYLFKVFPLDMSQYNNLFSSTRIPRINKDELYTNKKSKHVIVMRNGYLYMFDTITDSGKIIHEGQILANIKHILADDRAPNKHPIGILTSENRDIWANVRNELILEGNTDSLKIVDSAIFAIALDDFNENDQKTLVRNFLHGDGCSRWFDKSFTLILTKNGHAAINFEHSWGDGVAVARYFNDCYEDTTKNPRILKANNTNDYVAKVTEINFKLNNSIISAIHKAKENFNNRISDMSLNFKAVDGIGKKMCKKYEISPDSYMQLIFQMAFYRMYGKIVPSYESCSTALFRHGRTETIRQSTEATKLACELFNKKDKNSNELRLAVKQCSTVHNKLTKEAAMGQGWDRHLFALKNICSKDRIPSLFEDPAYININKNVISTSTVSSPAILIGSFGPVVNDGFGIGYAIHDEQFGCVVTAYPERDSHGFIEHCEECAHDIMKAFKN